MQQFGDIHRKYTYQSNRSVQYVTSLNEIVIKLKSYAVSSFISTISPTFYITIQKTIRDLLIDWNRSYRLHPDETLLLQNSIRFLRYLIENSSDAKVYSSWFFDASLIKIIAECLSNTDQLLARDTTKGNFQAFGNLFNLYSIAYRRSSERKDLDQLFEGIVDCLTSVKYDQTFRKLKPGKKCMRTKEKFFLSECPIFLCSKSTDRHSYSTKIIEQILETMIPRYAAILDQHTKSIQQWSSAMMHAIYHVLSVVLLVRSQFSQYATGQPMRWLVDHVIHILNAPTIKSNIDQSSYTCEIHLIESALKLFSAFVRDPDLLIYIQQLKIQATIRFYSSSKHEAIIYRTYLVLSYLMGEDDIKAAEKDAGRLLSNIFDSLRKQIRLYSGSNQKDELVEKRIALLAEAIQVLVEHDQIKSEILRQNALPLLINHFHFFNNKSQRLILESIGSMTFHRDAARVLRKNKDFLHTIEGKHKTAEVDVGIRKAAEKIIWNLVDEPEKVAKIQEEKRRVSKDEGQTKKEEYDLMISYCHDDKELVHKVHQFLSEKGFKIWIDREQMYGPAMDAMAQAVESSQFVVLCMSSSYKRSTYCQAEAEYAFRCKRRLIPLIVRPGYRPDGWLGLLLGSRIYVDFGKLDFKEGCESLVNEIQLQKKDIEKKQASAKPANPSGKDEEEDEDFDANPQPTTTTGQTSKGTAARGYQHRDTRASKYRSKDLKQWTSREILDFLFDSKLYLMMPLCESLNGEGLAKLFEMCQADPVHFHVQLNSELQSRSEQLLPIGIYTQFLTVVEDWVESKNRPPVENNINDTYQQEKRSETSTPRNVSRSGNNKSAMSTTTSVASTRVSPKNDINTATLPRPDEIRSNASTPPTINNIQNNRSIRTLSPSPTNSMKSTTSSPKNAKDETKTPDPISSPPNITPRVPIPFNPEKSSRNDSPASTSSSSSSSLKNHGITNERSSTPKPTITPTTNVDNRPSANTSFAFPSVISMKNGQRRSIPIPSPTQFATLY